MVSAPAILFATIHISNQNLQRHGLPAGHIRQRKEEYLSEVEYSLGGFNQHVRIVIMF
jgi:hypothetical protein